jgi:hypothetical protein
MHALFVCLLTEHPARPGFFGPKLLRELTPIPLNAYVVVPAHEAKPVAIGLVQISAEQAAAFDGVPGVWLFDTDSWRSKRISEIPAPTRAGLAALLADRGIAAGIGIQDTLAGALTKMVASIGEDPQALLSRYTNLVGAEL